MEKLAEKHAQDELKSKQNVQPVQKDTVTSAVPIIQHMNYHISGVNTDNLLLINVYLIINLPPGQMSNQPIVINVNIIVNK